MMPDPDRGEPGVRVFKVSELTRLIRATLEQAFGEVWIEGELSNVRRPASGHCYFTVKDASAQISAVLFRGNQRGLAFRPADGLQVRVFGELTVYDRGGNYQVIVRRMEQWGKGALQAQFEKLKESLRAEGLFDASRKRPLPLLPRRVGVVTSPTGAAIRDILNVIGRRFPNLHVLVAPARVQGDGAAAEIAAAVDLLNARSDVEVMIVGRGGGSLEDLWCFNEEPVARAIARSRIPVVSAVGHEIDFTISDFVADVRAPTPSAAAELVVDRKDAFEERLARLDRDMQRLLRQASADARARVRAVRASYVFREPGNLARQYRERLVALRLRAAHGLEAALRAGRQRVDEAQLRLGHGMQARRDGAAQALRRLQTHLEALSPLAVLARGYSVTRDAQGRVIRRASEASEGDVLETILVEGRLRSVVDGAES
jgi:exodeoxyribonuclease VII large subunit